MMNPHDGRDPSKLDAYLDGALTAEEHDWMAREITANPQLQADVELQKQVDSTLTRLFVPPKPPSSLLVQLRQSEAARPAMSPLRNRRIQLAALATAATIAWGLVAWHFFAGRAAAPRYNPNLPLEAIYEKCVADGFHPKWVCNDKREFASTFFTRQGQGLLLADMPAGTKMEGLTYCGGLSRYTTTMLARVDGSPVMVFVDRFTADTHPTLPSSEGKLHLFRKELGPLVVYELTPSNHPGVMDSLYLADVPSK
jgi:hypothetical protein